MLNFLISAWAWLNGKKTAIGAACLFIATIIIPQLFITTWHWTAFPQVITDTLMWVGGILTGTGLVHKAMK